MNDDDAPEVIRAAAARVRRGEVSAPADADLLADGILDPLELMALVLEIEEATGLRLPEDRDPADLGVYRVPALIGHIRAGAVIEAR